MSTNITVDVLLQRLKQVSDQTIAQNRAERQEREDALQQEQRDTTITSRSQGLLALQSTRQGQSASEDSRARSAAEHSGVPDLYKKRRPAAQRGAPTLLPFAISWNGELTGGYASSVVTLLRTYEVLGSGIRHDIITTTYSGGRELASSSLRFASSNAGIASPEIARKEPWRSNVVTCNVTPDPEGGGSCAYSLLNNFPNLWLTGAREETFDPYVPVTPAPPITLPIGQVAFAPTTSILTVANDGTVYLVFDLPKEPKALTARTFAEFENAGYPEDTLITDYDLVDLDYSFAYDPWRGIGQYIYSPQTSTRYIFIKAKGTVMESKVASRSASQDLKDFLYANLYSTDPSRDIRGEGYTGEYRIKGNTASFLRLKDQDGDYSGFPYNFLQGYKNASDVPEFANGEVFEDFVYSLSPWATPAQLKAQLEVLAASNDFDPAPTKLIKIPKPDSLFVKAKDNLGNDGGDELTPRLYLAIGQ